MYSITLIGNVDECRAECEISDENDTIVAVVYEADDGWHLETLKPVQAEELDDFNATVAAAKQNLSLHVNRLGANPPEGLTAAGVSLWLMEKGDGSALGIILPEVDSDVPSRMADIAPEVERRVRLLVKNGRPIEAIRELRRATDCSLQQAKAWLNK